MEVLDIVIRNLLTLFGDPSSQTPSTPGIFMRINIAKINTYNSVHTYAITSHLLLNRDNITSYTMIFPSKPNNLPAERNESKSELKFCQALKPYKCKVDMSHMRLVQANMKAKVPKCVLEIRRGKMQQDTHLYLTGSSVPPIEGASFRFVGLPVSDLLDNTEYCLSITQKLNHLVTSLDLTHLHRKQKLTVYLVGVCSRLTWLLMIVTLPITWVERTLTPLPHYFSRNGLAWQDVQHLPFCTSRQVVVLAFHLFPQPTRNSRFQDLHSF